MARINQVVGKNIASAVDANQLLQFVSTTKGPLSSLTFYPASTPSKDASEIILGFDPTVDLPTTFPKFAYSYQLGDPFIVGIPSLQNLIHDELVTVLLNEEVDYQILFGAGIIYLKLHQDR